MTEVSVVPSDMSDPEAHASCDVLIVGGGMVGLTLAEALAGAVTGGAGTLRIAVVDREDPARAEEAGFDGRTTAIALGGKHILDALGLWDGLAREASPILDIRVSEAESTLFLHYDHRDVGDEPLGFIVENRFIRRALMEKVRSRPSIGLWRGHLLKRLDQSSVPGAPAALAVLAGPDGREKRVRARLVVAADGRPSRLAREAGIPVSDWRYHQASIVCTIAHSRPHQGVAIEHFLPAGPFAVLPMQHNRSSIVWTEDKDLAAALVRLPEDEFLEEFRRRFGEWYGDLSLVGPRALYPLGVTFAHRLYQDRLVLVGDAAHAIHPIAGQGFNLALRDVATLAELIVDHHRLGLDLAGPLLEAYDRARRADTLALLAATDGLNRLFSNDIAPVRVLRGLGLAAVNNMPALKRFFMRHAMGIETGSADSMPRLARGLPL